ncbi:cupin domain-containing protein [Deltaproteobacteria bacterium Smac51]|nr:cupin domain-containing protein [Deltaproteobacteria bacterium Smac51]
MRKARLIPALALIISMGMAGQALSQNSGQQFIYKSGAQASARGPADFFTGQVRIDPLFAAQEPFPVGGAYVTFEPGARSHWHTHPIGQHLVVVSGVGRTGTADGHVEEIKAGDVVWCPPQIRHWHGAAPDTAMTHMALTGVADGRNVEWMEPVTDEQYNK